MTAKSALLLSLTAGCTLGCIPCDVYHVSSINHPNTVWMSGDGQFKHVVRFPSYPTGEHLTVAFGTWRKSGKTITINTEQSDWNKDAKGNWERQTSFTAIWPSPLAGEHRYQYKESAKVLELVRELEHGATRPTVFVLQRVTDSPWQDIPSVQDLKRPFDSWVK